MKATAASAPAQSMSCDPPPPRSVPSSFGEEAGAAFCGNKESGSSSGKKPQLLKQLVGHRKKELVSLNLHGWLLQK